MKIIAHRPFRDEHRIARFDPRVLEGFEGVELDLRCRDDGRLVVFHAPTLSLRGKPVRGAVKPLKLVLRSLRALGAPTERVFFDLKEPRAAERVGAAIELLESHSAPTCICWTPDDVERVRQAAPQADVLLAIAPLRQRWRRDGPTREWVMRNRFPYVAPAARWRRRAERFNDHSIGLRWFDLERIERSLPERVDGILFHANLFNRRFAAAVRAAGYRTAVWGFRSRADQRMTRWADLVDYGIVDPDFPARRPLARLLENAARA